MSKEAMKLALEFVEANHVGGPDAFELINTLKQALEQPEPEPVAWRTFDDEGGYDYRDYDMNENYDKEWAERNPNHAHWVEPLFVKEKK